MPQRKTAKWTTEMKRVLHLLNRNYTSDWRECTLIFNIIFQEHLTECGLPTGIEASSLKAQYSMRMKHASWKEIRQAQTTPNGIAEEDALIERIDVARLQVSGVPTTSHADSRRSQVRPRKRKSYQSELDKEDLEEIGENIIVMSRTANSETSSFHETRSRSPTEERSRKRRRISPKASQPSSTPQVPTVTSPFVRNKAMVVVKRVNHDLAADSPKITYKKPNGQQVTCTPKRYMKALEPLTPVSPGLAHPPTSALLFRFWDESSYGKNSHHGFVAARFQNDEGIINSPIKPPAAQAIPWDDLECHFNKRGRPSPFISTSNSLWWTLHHAIKYLKQGRERLNVTLLDASKLDPAGLYHAKPYVTQLKEKNFMDADKMYFSGLHEFLVHYKIPSSAILHTLKMKEFLAFATSQPDVTALLQPSNLGIRGFYRAKIRPLLIESRIQLTPRTVEALAKVVLFFGITRQSPIEQLSHLISDVVRDWVLDIIHQQPAEWLRLAGLFMEALVKADTHFPSIQEQEIIKLGFLNGVKLGLGDRNVTHNAERMRLMLYRANRVGLGSRETIVANELEEVRLRILSPGERQQRRTSNDTVAADWGVNTSFQRLTMADGHEDQTILYETESE